MFSDFKNKSTLDETRARFDNNVDRFADLETGQQSTIDAPLSFELITDAARPISIPVTAVLLYFNVSHRQVSALSLAESMPQSFLNRYETIEGWQAQAQSIYAADGAPHTVEIFCVL
ncbi:hypothetical protein [Pontibacter russatus]|uniref:hypothetical protein n=1 Tax=Pontibacter russatus TaxID=2694929 RepID=UPI00137A6163|nr:hypothetical protein [Pontibacter russatus]